jgi:hypothetical protein
MPGIVPYATPWWVNFLALVPTVPWLLSRKEKFRIGVRQLLPAALFGIAFGFVEAAVVVYLRAATGLWPGPPAKVVVALPAILLRIESLREAATIIMLGAVAWVLGQRAKERFIAFLWMFAFWDFFYYVWLRLMIGWPDSLLSVDVLFLIPAPWVAQVWFPILISSLTAVVIGIRCSRAR